MHLAGETAGFERVNRGLSFSDFNHDYLGRCFSLANNYKVCRDRRVKRISKGHIMLQTITVAGQITAQGTFIRHHNDGRVTISTGDQMLTGWPVARFLKAALANRA